MTQAHHSQAQGGPPLIPVDGVIISGLMDADFQQMERIRERILHS